MICMRVPPFSWVAATSISGRVTFCPRKSKFYLSVKHPIFRVRLEGYIRPRRGVCGELKLELQGVGEIKAADLTNRFNDSPPQTKCYLHPVETVMLESNFNLPRHSHRLP